MAIVKGTLFEIQSSSFPIIVGEALTDVENGIFNARIYNALYPHGTEMEINVMAPTRIGLQQMEYETRKRELAKLADEGKFGWPE